MQPLIRIFLISQNNKKKVGKLKNSLIKFFLSFKNIKKGMIKKKIKKTLFKNAKTE